MIFKLKRKKLLIFLNRKLMSYDHILPFLFELKNYYPNVNIELWFPDFDTYSDHEVDEDDISVIFLKCEDFEEKMKIFEDLNTYAKRQSKDVEIFGSVSNPWFVLCRNYVKNAEINKGVDFLKDFVQKKGTALGPRNKPITTATHIVQIAKFLTDKMKFKNPKDLYGGSVSPKNISILKKITNLDGFLIGGASQNSDKLIDIIKKTFN